MNPARDTSGWPAHDVVPPGPKLELAVQGRRTSRGGAAEYHSKVQQIIRLLQSSAAALAQNDYKVADHDRHEAWELSKELSPLIDATEREMCLPTDGCLDCGSPSAERCICDVPFP